MVHLGIGGQGDMRLICGTIVVRKKGRAEKGDKARIYSYMHYISYYWKLNIIFLLNFAFAFCCCLDGNMNTFAVYLGNSYVFNFCNKLLLKFVRLVSKI